MVKVLHEVFFSGSVKMAVVNLGNFFWPGQIIIIFIPFCVTKTAGSNIEQNKKFLSWGLRAILYETTAIISLKFRLRMASTSHCMNICEDI